MIPFDYDYPEHYRNERGKRSDKVRKLFLQALNFAEARTDGQVVVYDSTLEDDQHGDSLLTIYRQPRRTGDAPLVVEYQERSPLAVTLAKVAEAERGAMLLTFDEAIAKFLDG